MKGLFIVLLALLAVASVCAYLMTPDRHTEVPIVYWSVNPHPTREKQIQLFRDWLIDGGHTTSDGRPIMDVRVDPSDFDSAKHIIQGVSGVSADIIDLGDGTQLRFLHAVGMLDDLTEDAVAMGFDPGHTYPVLLPELTIDGRQYAFPGLTYAYMFNVNLATFRKAGLPPPPRRWTFEEFERIGRQFVEAANPPGQRRTVFMANEVRPMVVWRSLGLSIFNETLTRCTLDDPRYAEALRRIHKWKYEDHILPTEADLKAVATQQKAQFGASRIQMLYSGNYAMIGIGRHAIPELRILGDVEMAVVEPPHGGFPNTFAGTRCSGVYAGSKHRDLARLFLSFLASEDYNMLLVDDGDGIPPDPAVTKSDRYRRPADYPNEWGSHEVFSDAMWEIAIGGAYSPFVVPQVAYNIEGEESQSFIAKRYSAEEAGHRAARRINEEIERTLMEHLALRERHQELVGLQEKIDAYRAEGREVPLAWISNPVHRRYYQFKGWAGEE